jgi:hypothetical protein
MSEEILNHNFLGKKEEWEFLLYEILVKNTLIDKSNLLKISSNHSISLSSSIQGMLTLCEVLEYIKYDGTLIKFQEYSLTNLKKDNFFKNESFYRKLFNKLSDLNLLEAIFNEDSLKYDKKLKLFYLKESNISFKLFNIKNLLLSFNFLLIKDSTFNLYIDGDFTELINLDIISLWNKRRKFKEENLLKQLENKRKLGKKAEEYVVKYEKKRLVNHSNIKLIRKISEDYVNAGYDIESFQTIESVFLDKFIEVKSFDGKIEFYWSDNEIKIAKEKGDKYFLYLVDRSQIRNKLYKPKEIQNPYQKVFLNELWNKEANSWKIKINE